MTATQIPRPVAHPPAPARNVRVEDELWDDARKIAEAEGVTISEVVRHYLRHYVDTAPRRA